LKKIRCYHFYIYIPQFCRAYTTCHYYSFHYDENVQVPPAPPALPVIVTGIAGVVPKLVVPSTTVIVLAPNEIAVILPPEPPDPPCPPKPVPLPLPPLPPTPPLADANV